MLSALDRLALLVRRWLGRVGRHGQGRQARLKGNAGRRPSPADDGRSAQRLLNSRAATTSERVRFHGSRSDVRLANRAQMNTIQ